MNPLKQLESAQQSPWLDFVKRSLLEGDELKTMISRDGLKGMTSNPSIFEKAIGDSAEYDADLAAFAAKGTPSVNQVYEHLAIGDIQHAADTLKPVYDATEGVDGYVSLECSPYLANDTEATLVEARKLHQAVNRPNLMVKVPGTKAGTPAIRTLIGEGMSINVTLLFSIEAYVAVAEAYIDGIEARVKRGEPVDKIASVASFFVSRIDAVADKQLDEKIKTGGNVDELEALKGKVAIANAKLAYVKFKELFSGPRWEALAAKGAKVQRLLWASTGVKNKAYPDTLYIDRLIGPQTVNTMPPATMDAFRDHGTVKADAIEDDVEGAKAILAALEKAGISLAKITHDLVDDGVKQFADAFDKLLGAVASKLKQSRKEPVAVQSIRIDDPVLQKAVADEMEAWRSGGKIRRLWAGDAALWTGDDESKWLGWLRVAQDEVNDLTDLEAFSQSTKNRFTDVALLGMGGSSLGPEVLSLIIGAASGFPKFHVLDSTDPAQIATLEAAIDIKRTLFIVSSKSGSTLEPNIFKDYFFDRVVSAIGKEEAGAHFVAVTDPGSAMEKAAKDEHFAQIFYGLKSIGGRYSVLSKFGLVPAAAMGIELKMLLASAVAAAGDGGPDVPPAQNDAVQLGIAMGVAARDQGRDKVTVLASPKFAAFGAWLEQLLAESTGKIGKGLVPVDGEAAGAPARYGSDRFFVHLQLEGDEDEAQKQAIDAIAAAGHPLVRIKVPNAYAVGGEFFRWELATAVAGSVIGINAFNQPDVEDSKIKTRELTDAADKSGKLPPEQPIFESDGIKLFTDPENAQSISGSVGTPDSLQAWLKAHFARVQPVDYVALLAYIERNTAHTEVLQTLRLKIRDLLKTATCLGFGPRFLHSTGQAYKGGPATGVFLQITCDDAKDLAIPSHGYSFGTVKAAQARGDFGVLAERKRRALRVHLPNTGDALNQLAHAIETAIA
jgi:transaldolase/glucose-6-phosphate isomerase